MLRSCPLGWLLVFEVNNLKINKKYLGIIYIIISAFCFALMNTFVKLSGDLPSIQKSFFRNFVAMIFAAILLIKSGQGFKFKKGNLGLLLARSIFGTLGILCNFYAIDHLVLSDASMLNKMSPFFVIIFSLIFLHEKVNKVQTLAVIIAFLGSLLIIKPSFNLTEFLPALLGFIGGLGAGAAYTAVRRLGQKGENGKFVVFFFFLFFLRCDISIFDISVSRNDLASTDISALCRTCSNRRTIFNYCGILPCTSERNFCI